MREACKIKVTDCPHTHTHTQFLPMKALVQYTGEGLLENIHCEPFFNQLPELNKYYQTRHTKLLFCFKMVSTQLVCVEKRQVKKSNKIEKK